MYKIIKFFSFIILKVLFRFKVVGAENIPAEGKLILCANHSSNFDVLMLAMTTKREIHFMAKEELFRFKPMGWVLKKAHGILVHRDGNDMLAIRSAIRILGGGEVLGIFPQGTRDKGGLLKSDSFKPGVATISVKTQSLVVPVYISEDYKIFRKQVIYVGSPIETWENMPKKPTQEDYDYVSNTLIRGAILELKTKCEEE